MTTTREQRLRELCDKWRNPKWEATNDDEQGFLECLGYCADELAAILNEPVDVSEEMVANALLARVPGGARVWHWLPSLDGRAPHPTAVDVIRTALTAALKEPGQ